VLRAAGPSRNYSNSRPDAIVFPLDLNETTVQVVDCIFRLFGLSDTFPKSVNKQVNTFIASDPTSDPSLRDLTDLSDLPFITIDNDNSLDLDHAMHIQRRDNDNGYYYCV